MDLNDINKFSEYFDAVAVNKPKPLRGKRDPLVELFKAAQEQVFQATLQYEDSAATKESLNQLILSTQSLKRAYTYKASNLAVRIGLIKPRGMKEAFHNADALIKKAQAAIEFIEDHNKTYVVLDNLKNSLKGIEGDDPDILIRMLENSGTGQPYEFCRKELVELALDQWVSLLKKSFYSGINLYELKKGKWTKVSSKLSISEKTEATRSRLLSYMPYLKFSEMQKYTNYAYHDDYGRITFANKMSGLLSTKKYAVLMNFLKKGVNAASQDELLHSACIAPETVPIIRKIARDTNHPVIMRQALLLDYLKDLSVEDRSSAYDEISHIFLKGADLQESLDNGVFDARNISGLWEIVKNGILEKEPLVDCTPQLRLPLFHSLAHLEDEQAGHNFETRAVLFIIKALKEGFILDSAEASGLFKDISLLKSWKEKNPTVRLEENEALYAPYFRVFNKLHTLKALGFPLEEALHELLPGLAEMAEQISLPSNEQEAFAVSAMRYALEAHSDNPQSLFEQLMMAAEWDQKYPLLQTFPEQLNAFSSLDEEALDVLKKKFPYIVHVIELLKWKDLQAISDAATLPIDCQIDLHITPKPDIKEGLIYYGKNRDPEPHWRKFASLPGDYHRVVDLDDDWVESHEEDLFRSAVDLSGTAVTPRYALELQKEYGDFPYDDTFSTAKRLLNATNEGDIEVIQSGQSRRVFSELILEACPGRKIVKDETLHFPVEFTEQEWKTFLEFCYTGSITYVPDDILFSLYAKADALGSEALKSYCFYLLVATTRQENVLSHLRMAEKFNAVAIWQYVVRYIKLYCKPDMGNFTDAERDEIYAISKTIIDQPIVSLQPVEHKPDFQSLKAFEADFQLVSKDGEAISVNKTLIALRSGYFAALKRFARKVGNDREQKEVHVDFDKETLTALAGFLKSGTLPGSITDQELRMLWKAAQYFDIPLLKFLIMKRRLPIIQSLNPAMTVFQKDWQDFALGELDEFSDLVLLPENIEAILSAPSPFHLNKTVRETHELVYIPAGLTCSDLEKLGFKVSEDVKALLGEQKTEPHWILIFPGVIRRKRHDTRRGLESLLSKKSTDLLHYEFPQALDRMIVSVAEKFKSKENTLGKVPTLCAETTEDGDLLVGDLEISHPKKAHSNAFGVTPVIILS